MMRTIMPLLRQEFVCLMMITTEGADGTVYRDMFSDDNIFYKGGKAFSKVRIAAVCDDCYALGLRETCKHRKQLTPEWITEEREELVKHFQRFDPEAFHKESLGLAMNAGNNVFEEEYLKRWFGDLNSSHMLDVDMRHVFVSIDPQGSHRPKDTKTGDKAISHFAIVSFVRDYTRKFAIMGAENICSSNPHDYRPILVDHVRRLAQTHYLTRAKIVLIVEDNMANEATLIFEALKNIPELRGRLIPMSDHSRRLGQKTTEESKWKQVTFTNELLHEDHLYFNSDFFTSHKEGPEKVKRIMYDEFSSFKSHRKKSNVPGSAGQPVLSGKSGDGRKRDDMVMATIIGLENAEAFLTRRAWMMQSRR